MSVQQKIIISTHFLNYGASHALRDYLLSKKISQLLCIDLPFYSQKNTIITRYANGKQQNKSVKQRRYSGSVVSYLLDPLEICLLIFRQNQSYDVFFGVDNLNCLTGIILKTFGKVKKVIYYSIDFTPIRFHNKLLNFIYHEIEKFCVKHADETWNVSPRIAEGREKFLQISQKNYVQKVVPIGVWDNVLKKNTLKQKNQMVFIGHILEKQGIQEVLRALPIIKKRISDIELVVVGGGEYLDQLQNLTRKLRLTESVRFLGWINDERKKAEIFQQSKIALAPYKPEKKQLYNFTYYADPTKLKEYLANGLPVILTDVSYNAKEIHARKCGIIVEYSSSSIAKAVISLLTDNNLTLFADNARKYARTFTWEKIFTTALS
jgi:glycosyltransferase involved in cell wall biosynthesis